MGTSVATSAVQTMWMPVTRSEEHLYVAQLTPVRFDLPRSWMRHSQAMSNLPVQNRAILGRHLDTASACALVDQFVEKRSNVHGVIRNLGQCPETALTTYPLCKSGLSTGLFVGRAANSTKDEGIKMTRAAEAD